MVVCDKRDLYRDPAPTLVGREGRVDHLLRFKPVVEAGGNGMALYDSVDEQARADRLFVKRGQHRRHLVLGRVGARR